MVSLMSSLICLIYMAADFPGGLNALSEALRNSDAHIAVYFVVGVVCLVNNVFLISVYLVLFSISNGRGKMVSDS